MAVHASRHSNPVPGVRIDDEGPQLRPAGAQFLTRLDISSWRRIEVAMTPAAAATERVRSATVRNQLPLAITRVVGQA
jgi:hypothetical protein